MIQEYSKFDVSLGFTYFMYKNFQFQCHKTFFSLNFPDYSILQLTLNLNIEKSSQQFSFDKFCA